MSVIAMDANGVGLPRTRDLVKIAPMREGDADVVQKVFDGMSERSRWLRFCAPMPTLPARSLRSLAAVDGHRHVAFVAYAVSTGAAIGIGRYIRTGDATAEFSLAIVDAWHGFGIGSTLLEVLVAHAVEHGLEEFEGTALAENRPILGLMARRFNRVHNMTEYGMVEFRVTLSDRRRQPISAAA